MWQDPIYDKMQTQLSYNMAHTPSVHGTKAMHIRKDGWAGVMNELWQTLSRNGSWQDTRINCCLASMSTFSPTTQHKYCVGESEWRYMIHRQTVNYTTRSASLAMWRRMRETFRERALIPPIPRVSENTTLFAKEINQ